MLTDHPQRFALSSQLHARPFPKMTAPTSAAFLAITSTGNEDGDWNNLISLLKYFDRDIDVPQGNHHYCDLGTCQLKWEKHTEFVSYTLIIKRKSDELFAEDPFELIPQSWMENVEGHIITSCLLDVIGPSTQKAAEAMVSNEFYKFFIPESLAVNYVLDKQAVVASDFSIDSAGHIKFAVIAIGQVGENRLGRIIQRMFEIEVYKSLAMLTFPIAQDIFRQIEGLNEQLTTAVQAISEGEGTSQNRLDALLSVSAKIEYLQSHSTYRFSSAEAYSTLVDQRIKILREERLQGRQTFSEFMMRRFDPAMKTCKSARIRLRDISKRSERASELLATRVTVRTNEQNRQVLHQMDERASLQLRLQETVEGLSVVAISYYAVNLATYLLYPLTKVLNFEKWQLTAALIIPMVSLVWFMIRQIKKRSIAKE